MISSSGLTMSKIILIVQTYIIPLLYCILLWMYISYFTEEFEEFSTYSLAKWEKLYTFWFEDYDKPILLVVYEEMVVDVEQHLEKMAAFLNINYTDKDINCTLENQRGQFLRKPGGVTIASVYDENMRESVKEATLRVLSMLHTKFPTFSNLSFKSL